MAKKIKRIRERKLSDEEVALAKALLARGRPNDEVHFYFNHADRLISSGRIAQIKNGEYGGEVPPASEARLEKFLQEWRLQNDKSPSDQRSPIGRDLLLSMFAKSPAGWTMTQGETDRIECKQSFRLAPEVRFADVIKAIAGLANNRGGYIFFGVEDRTFEVTGLANTDFASADPAAINRSLASSLDPVPRVLKTVLQLSQSRVGVLYVEQQSDAPVIALKNIANEVKEGGIYYRYVGETRLIKPAELRQVIERRVQRGLAAFARRMTRVATGSEATIDLESGYVEGTTGRFLIDKELLKQIQFLREGDFSEIKGAPALRLIGEVEPASQVERERVKVIRENVTPDSVVRNFLRNEPVADPLQYIQAQVHQQRRWMPIWYYVRLSKRTPEQIVADLSSLVPTHPANRTALTLRLQRRLSAKNATSGRSAAELAKLLQGEIQAPANIGQDLMFCMAVQGLPDDYEHADQLRGLVLGCLDRAQGEDTKTKSRRSAIYRAACRLDELMS